MQAVSDLRFLEVAEEIVERLERLALVGRQRHVDIEPGVAAEVENTAAQVGEPAPVHARGGVVLVEQRLEVLQGAIGFGPCQRRHQVVDDHRAGTTLGLRPLAGIVDDEGIKMRQPAPQRHGIARGVERHGLARQPFEIAVLAVVDQRMRRKLVP